MRLTFDRTRVHALLEHALAASERRPTFAQLYDPAYRKAGREHVSEPEGSDIDRSRIPAGLWLVGDQGVYLLSNADPGPTRPPEIAPAYAREADPERLAFEDWWAAKHASFGGDDGVEFLSAASIQSWLDESRGDTLIADVSSEHIRLLLR